MASTPQLMVSSTFYDLSQVRDDLRRFIDDDLGYTPLLSEMKSFPINPDKNTIENCKEKVRKNADLLILIVGTRYGSIDLETDKSITNLEYEAAKRKGIPIYVFIDKRVINLLPTWKANQDADFSSTVDTTKLFDFVDKIRSSESIWTFPFEKAVDIIDTLRHQLAHLFLESLQLREKFTTGGILPPHLQDLKPEALQIALEKTTAWEYRLYLQSWIDEVDKRKDLVRKFEANISMGISEYVRAEQAKEWFDIRIHELSHLINAANHLINVSTQEAFGENGKPGDEEKIIWTAKSIGELFEKALQWSDLVRKAKVEEPFAKVAKEMIQFPRQMIHELQKFPKSSLEQIHKALETASEENPQTVEMTLKLDLSNEEKFHEALEAAKNQYNL